MKFDIVSFGSALVDVFVNTNVAERGKFMAYPVGSKILIKDLKFDIGGGGVNTAVAFSRLGLKTGYIGKIGYDERGQDIIKLIKKEKVKFLGKIEKGKKSGYSIILDSKEKNRTILSYKGINNELSFSGLPKKIKTKWLYFSSVLGKSFETQKKLARKLKKKGIKIAFNPSSYLIKRKNLKDIIKMTDILILNKEEAEMLTKKKENLLESLYELGAKIVVITNKNHPVFCFDGIKEYSLKPSKIKVIERTGAGDAFASGFVAGIIAGKTLPQSLFLGLKESEAVIRYFGSRNKLLRMNVKKWKKVK